MVPRRFPNVYFITGESDVPKKFSCHVAAPNLFGFTVFASTNLSAQMQDALSATTFAPALAKADC